MTKFLPPHTRGSIQPDKFRPLPLDPLGLTPIPRKIRIDIAEDLRQRLSLPGDLPQLIFVESVQPIVDIDARAPPEWYFAQDRRVVSRDRSGRVIYFDGFENYTAVITEKLDALGIGATVALATDFPRTGLSCSSCTTAAVADREAGIMYYMGSFPRGRFGLEFGFQCASGLANLKYLLIVLGFYNGTQLYQGVIRWVGTDVAAIQRWEYNDGAWNVLSGGSYDFHVGGATQPTWHVIKLVLDSLTEKYVRLDYNDTSIDMSDLNLQKTNNATSPSLYLSLSIITETANATVARFDDVILTNHEP